MGNPYPFPIALNRVEPGSYRCYQIGVAFSGDEKLAIITAAHAENMNLATWIRKLVLERITLPQSDDSLTKD